MFDSQFLFNIKNIIFYKNKILWFLKMCLKFVSFYFKEFFVNEFFEPIKKCELLNHQI